jgi:hypothetical protein
MTEPLEQGPPVMRGSTVNRCLQAGKLFVEDIDERLRNVILCIYVSKYSSRLID